MRTLTAILITSLTCAGSIFHAQQLNFDAINSSNALNIITQLSASNTNKISSETIAIQNGTRNYAEVNLNKNTNAFIQQLGDFNYLNFNNSFETTPVNTIINTQGNNNIVDVVGSNSISDKMQIHVKGDNMTMFIRNF